jgi:DNA polymerase III delta prime subunit
MNLKENLLLNNLKLISQPVLIVLANTDFWNNLILRIAETLEVSKSDLIEFDPKEGVEELRKKISEFNVRPHSSQLRLFVIYKADQLNAEEANTLLKTLEEPPLYGRTVLFARTSSRVLSTLKSRCQKIVLSSKIIHDRESIIKLLEIKGFGEFIREIKNLEKDEINSLLEGGLEELKTKRLNNSELWLYYQIAETLRIIEITNVNYKLLLEDLYISRRASIEKNI